MPDGVLGVTAFAEQAGVSGPTVLRWQSSGRLPEPDFTTARGRHLWLQATVKSWLDSADYLTACQVCGARCLSVGHHAAAVHP